MYKTYLKDTLERTNMTMFMDEEHGAKDMTMMLTVAIGNP